MDENRTIDAQRKRSPLRKRFGSVWTWIGLAAAMICAAPFLHAQVTTGTGRGKNFVAPVTDAQGRRSVLRGKDVVPVGKGVVEITQMQAETFRGQEKDMLVEAPKCIFDSKANVASSAGDLTIRTADGRFSIEGKSFRWQMGDSRLNSKLVISNAVHSLVRKGLVSSKTLIAAGGTNRTAAATPGTAVSSPAGSPGEVIEITSDGFEYQADRAIYRGHVLAKQADGNLICEVLSVVFAGEGGALERVEADGDVVLDQGTTRATADKGVYVLGGGKEFVDLTGHATWTDGPRQGTGSRVSLDRRAHILRAEEKAYLRLPRGALGDSGLLGGVQMSRPVSTSLDTNSYVEVFADLMTIHLPATNGPVQKVVAEKNVLIVDPEQATRALADRAVYEDATGVLELTGSPMVETERRLLTGKVIKVDRATRVLTAEPDAYLKLPVEALAQLGASSGLQTNSLARTNGFVEAWCKSFRYSTNLLECLGAVRANYLEGDIARGKLTCDTMRIRFGEQVESLVAEGDVEVEQFADRTKPQPAARKMNCRVLRAEFSAEGRLERVKAEEEVVVEQEETRPELPSPTLTKLTCALVTARFFSGSSNRLERVDADQDVIFTQDGRMAKATNAVYSTASGLVELTGSPTAVMPEGRITESERLIWDRARQRFSARGKFKSEWKRTGAATNQFSLPTARK